jgi:methylmalonyl-CoA carboxyltransferase large subunit
MESTKKNAAEASAASDSPAMNGIQQAIEALTAQLAQLNSHLASLQMAMPTAALGAAAAPAPGASAPAAAEEISEEVVLALSAAIAAYLGKRPRIRAIRVLQSGAWGQQGRVFVQASHRLNIAHDAHAHEA